MNETQSLECLNAFEAQIKNDPVRGIYPDYFLKRLVGKDQTNPEYIDLAVDKEWTVWRKSWETCLSGLNYQEQV